MTLVMLCKNAMNQVFETQTFRRYGLNFKCILDENKRCRKCCSSQFHTSEQIKVHLIKHWAGAICYHHAEPLKSSNVYILHATRRIF